jgi:hypothetical protein
MIRALKILAATPASEWLGMLAFIVIVCLGVML